jgi:hypothetical protein
LRRKKKKMNKKLGFVSLVVFCFAVMVSAGWAEDEKGSASPNISEFRAYSQFRSVKIVWQSSLPATTAKSFQITRSIYEKDGPYTPLATVQAKEGENNYTYVDKDIAASENHYYKITVEGTGETFGPAVARPFLSQPAT